MNTIKRAFTALMLIWATILIPMSSSLRADEYGATSAGKASEVLQGAGKCSPPVLQNVDPVKKLYNHALGIVLSVAVPPVGITVEALQLSFEIIEADRHTRGWRCFETECYNGPQEVSDDAMEQMWELYWEWRNSTVAQMRREGRIIIACHQYHHVSMSTMHRCQTPNCFEPVRYIR